jgi:spore coat protein A, manganese oxidase
VVFARAGEHRGMGLSRRELLKLGVFGSAALMLPAERVARTQLALTNRLPQSALPLPFTVPFAQPPVLSPVHTTATTAYYDIEQRQFAAEILPGLETTCWGYNGVTPGPTVVAQQGQQVVMRQVNSLPAAHPSLRYEVWTSTHLHGSASLPQYDGYASDITRPGQYKDYWYPNNQDARSMWYHDHGVHITATNAQMGLAAMYIVHDAKELSLPIPHGEYDVPLVLKDAMFQQNGDLIMDDNDHSGMYGDVILVNGRPWPVLEVEPRKYRFRILNASISRSFELALDTDGPMTVIGTDGGLMPHPQEISRFRIGNAERYEVVIDFAAYRPGQRVVLRNLQPPNNIEYDTTDVVMAFRVGGTVTSRANNEIPADLHPESSVMQLTEADSIRTRHFDFGRSDGEWTINGTTWADVVDSDYEFIVADPGFEDVEIWELQNSSGAWFHPVHIHLVDFKVLDRNGQPPLPHERGPKDVVYVGEGERVRVIMRFEHQRGKYMMHCHNLVHEDHDMMAQFRVGGGGDDPIEADPCRAMPARPLYRKRDDEQPPRPPESGGDDPPADSGRSSEIPRSGGGSSSAPAPTQPSTPAPAEPSAPSRRRKRRRRRRKAERSRKPTRANGRGKNPRGKAPQRRPPKRKPKRKQVGSRRRR